jgi:hypothetical protein
MIVRSLPSGDLALMGQTDHSRLVGQFAAHWGNAEFATPEPYDSVVRAAIYHDFGWLGYEMRPLADPESGKPYEFRSLPFRTDSLEAYGRWIDWATDVDPYAGLIIGKHRTGLWQQRYGTIDHPGMNYNPRGMKPEIATFIEEQEARQAQLAAECDPHQLQVNYHLLQVWDLLGLYFCCHEPHEDYIAPVPTSYTNGSSVRLELTPRGAREVAMAPYPFDVRPLTVQIGYKELPDTPFADQESFRRAYFQADQKLMTYTLV